MSESKQSNEHLSEIQRFVTQENGTEQPFNNEYWNNKKEGIYVDVVSGKVLFSSKDKYDSGSGWPSFTKPIDKSQIITKIDTSNGTKRIEVRSADADSHLGHLFDDGPIQAGGLRYCINSAALRFIPKEELEKSGYREYLKDFTTVQKNESTKDQSTRYQKAILAGGCFWGMQQLLSKLNGVITTKVGYTGGTVGNPNYEIVKKGDTGHAEAVEVTFDPKKLSYENLLKFFFKIHNPTTPNKQLNDVGTQYRSAIFYMDEQQKQIAEDLIKKINQSKAFNSKIVTEITEAKDFYPAEDYHQDYLRKNPNGYTCHYVRKDLTF